MVGVPVLWEMRASEPREGAEGPAAAAIANGERPRARPVRTIPCGQFHGLPSRVGSSWCSTIRWADRPADGSAYTAALGNWAPASRPVRAVGGVYSGAEVYT